MEAVKKDGFRQDRMIEISLEQQDVRGADREKRREQITQPYGILLSPLFPPSCLSLQEECHLLSFHSLFPTVPSTASLSFPSIIIIIIFCSVIFWHTNSNVLTCFFFVVCFYFVPTLPSVLIIYSYICHLGFTVGYWSLSNLFRYLMEAFCF